MKYTLTAILMLIVGGAYSQAYWQHSGSWLGDLPNYGFVRIAGLNSNDGEFVVWQKNGQCGTLIDGSYYAYENGGFYTSFNSSFKSIVGFNATSDGAFNINVPYVRAGGFLMWHSGNLNNSNTDFSAKSISCSSISTSGNIWAKEIKIALTNPWPDYVFSPSYKLMTLPELSTFVGKYRHLPDMPSAEEAERGGVNIGEMNAKLLKKIEELTLYLIEKDKKISELEEQVKDVNEIKSKVEILVKELNVIKNK